MTRAPHPLLSCLPALLVLAAAGPLAAQQSPGSFTLPQPSPSPTRAPAGPADERAGVPIPPRVATPTPRIEPAPVLTGEPSPSPSPRTQPQPQPTARPAAPVATGASAPSPAARTAPSPALSPQPLPLPLPLPQTEPDLRVPRQPGTSTAASAPSAAPPATPASDALGAPLFDWRWLAGAGALLVLLAGGWALWRRRKPKVLRLAAPASLPAFDDEPALTRIDVALEIPGATRSLMMFTLRYRITLANRTDRAVNDLAVAVTLASAQRGADKGAALAAAPGTSEPIARIGPHQSRSLSGEVQMPLAAITPVMQGRTPLFIPLLHVTLEGQGQPAQTRSFVIGTPGQLEGRVQPLRLDMPPGSVPALRARPIEAPTAA